MSVNGDNRRRAFADVVSIDAWHAEFSDGRASVALHADVVFGTARVGGEVESPVRFRMSVRRAELVVVVPSAEPVSVDPESVAREAPKTTGAITETILEGEGIRIKGGAAAKVGPKGVGISAHGEVEGHEDASRSKKLELKTKIDGFKTTQSKTAAGEYRWIIEAYSGGALDGRPWDATKEPRMKLVDERKDKARGIEPAVRLELRCRTEDLEISDLEVKDEKLMQQIQEKLGFGNRMAAAIAFIKRKLQDEGLEIANIEDRFGQLTLANVLAEPRKGR